MTFADPQGVITRGTSRHVQAWCLALSVAYVATGSLAASLMQPPIYASPIFPPAGLAIAGAFIAGRRSLPWIFFGALSLNLWLASSLPEAGTGLGMLSAVLFAFASTLQAQVGGWALRRVIGWPCAMDTTRQVFAFPLLCLAICLTSASLSTAARVVLGTLEPSDVLTTWGIWWIGDTLGVLVMLPLILVFAGRPRSLWRPRALTVAVPMLLCLLAVAVLYDRTKELEGAESLGEFQRLSQQFADRLEAKLEARYALLDVVAGFMVHDSQRGVSREEFHAIVEKPLSRFRALQAIAWAPRVEGPDRDAFEAKQRGDFPGYEIRQRNGDGTMVRAADRTEYFPVTFIEPRAGNELALGFDIASTPERHAALAKSIELHVAAATSPVRLVYGDGTETGVLLVLAVGQGAKPEGVVMTIIRSAYFVNVAMDPFAAMLAARLIDVQSGDVLFDSVNDRKAGALFERSIDFGTRRYLLQTAPTPLYLADHAGWASWGGLAVGIFGTGLLGALLMLGTGHATRVKSLVDEQTAQLSETQSFLRYILEFMPNPVFIKDENHHLIEINDAFCRLLGKKREELIGRTGFELFPDDEVRVFREKDNAVFASGTMQENEERITSSTGDVGWSLTRKAPFQVKTQRFLVGVITDITKLKQAEASIRALALEDSLTGLPNRRMLSLLLHQAQAHIERHGTKVALMIIDLDNFKQVNDTLGHSAGDQLLVEVARRLRHAVRQDDVVARLGGDEFAVLLTSANDPSELGGLAERLVERLREPVAVEGAEVRPGASIGVAVGDADATDTDRLLAQADLALYASKEGGRNTWRFFEPEMQQRACALVELERDLCHALERGEFRLQYQPIVRTDDLTLHEVEALIRWEHPTRGLLLPGQFLPGAERGRLVVGLTFWTVTQALRQAAAWNRDGHRIHVSVNLATAVFEAEGLVEHIATSLLDVGLPAEILTVEVVEEAMVDRSKAIAVLSRLRWLGVRVAIDDFGAGHSSLARLDQLPLDILKIDRAFLTSTSARSEAILRATVDLAASLGLMTVLEGVETREQFELASWIGADCVQGFLFARGMPANEIPGWLEGLAPGRNRHPQLAELLTRAEATASPGGKAAWG